jgi:RsiW-degrading membrane proteinase PrsW (M82 family)
MPCAAYVVWVYFEAIVMIQRFNSVPEKIYWVNTVSVVVVTLATSALLCFPYSGRRRQISLVVVIVQLFS